MLLKAKITTYNTNYILIFYWNEQDLPQWVLNKKFALRAMKSTKSRSFGRTQKQIGNNWIGNEGRSSSSLQRFGEQKRESEQRFSFLMVMGCEWAGWGRGTERGRETIMAASPLRIFCLIACQKVGVNLERHFFLWNFVFIAQKSQKNGVIACQQMRY